MPVAADKLAAQQADAVPHGDRRRRHRSSTCPASKPNELKLTGEILADIYLGKITKWNDPKHRRAEPRREAAEHRDRAGVSRRRLGHDVRVHRLPLPQSPDWKSKVGAATSVNWPAGTGAKGSDGVAGTVRQIPGGIGYVESAYADAEPPDHGAAAQQGRQVRGADDGRRSRPRRPMPTGRRRRISPIDLNDQPGAESWPIDSATFVLLPTDPKDADAERRGEEVLRLGLQPTATNRHEAALRRRCRQSVQDAVRAAWKTQLQVMA